MQLFLGAEQFSVLNKGKCIQIPKFFLFPLSTLYKALFPHAFSYPDPPLPYLILE